MECTQRLECTQELYGTQTQNERLPEQIGFLGICGTKYPVKKGPNKIGRDPQTCNIVLKLHSVSRQHAVINILNKKNFMLMDLDSANKTKLSGQTLQPYIPHPLQNGDTVQFGEIFGIFRLLEEETDLPMTQALDIPDTPVPMKHISRVNAITTIPESPDVSDRDDSFIVPSQPKGHQFQSPKTRNFIKPGKTISIQPVGTNKIDNVYWNSSKKSNSLILDDTTSSLNDSVPPAKLKEEDDDVVTDIHELETQEVFQPHKVNNDCADSYKSDLHNAGSSIHTANTQMPSSPSIHSLETQMPSGISPPSIHNLNTQMCSASTHTANTQMSSVTSSPSIHSLETQMPGGISPPSIHNLNTQMCSASVHTANTQMPSATSSPSIHSLETQMPGGISPPSIHNSNTQMPGAFGSACVDIHNLETQLPPVDNLPEVCKISKQQYMQIDFFANKENNESIYNAETQIFTVKKESDIAVRSSIIDSPRTESNIKLNRTSDEVLFDEVDNEPFEDFESQPILSEDIDLPINRLLEPDNEFESQSEMVKPKSAKRNRRIKSDSSTDCEDIDILPTQKITTVNKIDDDGDKTDCEEELIELNINNNDASQAGSSKSLESFEELATQPIILGEAHSNVNKDIDFEDMPTQVLVIDDIEKDTVYKETMSLDNRYEDLPTQVLPVKKRYDNHQLSKNEESPFKIPFNSPLKGKKKDISKTPKIKQISTISNMHIKNTESNKYYKDTQDVYDDLCTQKIEVPGMESENAIVHLSNAESFDKSETKRTEKSFNKLILDTSLNSNDAEETVNDFVSNLSSQEVRDVIGVDKHVATVKKVPSDGSTASDVETTPKKQRPFKFSDIDLPNSQEIKTVVSLSTRTDVTESSSESDTEVNSEEQCTPILFRKKTKPKPTAKLDLTKKFDIETLPSRIITRVRKPTAKIQDTKKGSENILKPKFMSELEGEISNEIITENITRLKNKNEKTKNVKCGVESNNSTNSSKEIKLAELNKDKNNFESRNSTLLNKEVIQAGLNKNIKQDNIQQGKSNKEISLSDLNEDTKYDKLNKKVKQTYLCNDAKDTDSSKDIEQASAKKVIKLIDIESISDTVKKQRSCRKKPVKDERERGANKTTENTKDSSKQNSNESSKEDKRRKRERKDTKTESTDLSNRTVINSTKQSFDSTVESQNKVTSGNRSKEIDTLDLTVSPVVTKKSTRSTRNANKTKDKTPERDSQKNQTEKPNKRKYTRKHEPKENKKEGKQPSPEKEVRRSKRQKTVKETKEEPVKVTKSLLKKSITLPHEESAVYNVSSGSNSDSSRNFKRPALDDSDAPWPKKTRSADTNTTSLRATPALTVKTQYVLFTAFPYGEVKIKLEKIGAVVVTDLMKSTVLLTRQIKRTFKLLCAVGLGKPIVGPNWVQACADNNMIVDPWLYLMKDEEAEKRFSFSLERTLTGKRNFLGGYNVSSTPNVVPKPHELKLIVECSGGTWKEGGPQWICVSSPEDRPLWPELHSRGAILVSTEFILAGALKQRLDINANKFRI